MPWNGKWAVTFEVGDSKPSNFGLQQQKRERSRKYYFINLTEFDQEWLEEIYEAYANGPAHIEPRKIAKFIASKHEKGSLKVSSVLSTEKTHDFYCANC